MIQGFNTSTELQRWKGASNQVVQSIRNAASRTGVSFDYLMNKAKQESSFNPNAKASTSSATGLFQFIESTWLRAVKVYGDQFGMGHLSAKISKDGKVADPAARQEILKLRENPEIASNMVAAMTRDNANYLENSLGGKVGQNELYLAHFLGLGGANEFLKAKQNNPMQAAADVFPAAANANKNVFYDASGRKKTIQEVYDFFASKMSPSDAPAVTMMASAGMNASGQGKYNLSALSGAGRSIRHTASAQEAMMMPMTTGQLELLHAAQRGERQMLESLLAGVGNFDIGKKTASRPDGNLLSPYTSYILAHFHAPEGHYGKTDKS